MDKSRAAQFLAQHGMDPESIQPARDAAAMTAEMEEGLANHDSSLPMIPTYLSAEGAIPKGVPVAVIDAGGTNYRRALVTFTDGGYQVDEVRKWKMPGAGKPASWEDFVRFAADSLMDIIDRTDRIGFCFSYSAEITPEMDGRVRCIDKEVVIRGCEGQLVGQSLLDELKRRGVTGKSVVILNDTVAVLLGGLAVMDQSAYGGFIGQVSGTGTNTCCSLPACRIPKLGRSGAKPMVVNLESGFYNRLPTGSFDKLLDSASEFPGQKILEKITAGVYLGELVRQMLKGAAEEGLLSAEGARKALALGRIDSAVIDAWACGEKLDEVCGSVEDEAFVRELCEAVFKRSARGMCLNQAAILLLTGEGKESEKPVCICAEGSLVQKGRVYRPELERLIREEIGEKLGRHAVLHVGQETTLPGAAAAALLNT